MKFFTPSGRPTAFLFARLLLPVCLAAALAPARADETEATAPEPKTHTLFMGANFSVEQNKELYPVQNVVGSAFVIKVKGKEVKVPMNFGVSKFKIDPALKLTETSATVTNLKGERAYTLGNDPTVRFQRGLADSQLQYSDSVAQQHQANAGLHFGDAATAVSNAAAKADSHAPTTTSLATAVNQQNAQANLQSISNGAGSRFQEKGSPLDGEGMFDAIDVSFEVASKKPLNQPYLVIMARYHAPEDKPGQVSNWVYARELPAIGREPVKVQFLQGGFPQGYTMQDFQVHLYNQGEEIATTVAPQRVALTRNEAYLYMVSDYVGSHKGATLPAAPMMGALPADLQARLAQGEFKQTFYVRVGKDGKAGAAFLDAAGAQAVDDAYLQAVLRNIRFKPALDKGKPVEGVAAFKLSELLM